MIETFCKICGDRYPLGQDHECKKRPAKKSSGGSSAVERRVANAKAAGSIPARRSKEPRSTAGTQRQNTTAAAPEAVAGGPAAVNGATTLSTAARSSARVMVPRVCEVCGDAFEAVPHEVKRGKARTCSMACAAKLAARPDQTGESNPNWKGGVPSSEIKRTYKDRHPEKAAAHAALTGAIRRGEVVRQPCEVCGATETEGHHDDYSKPLDVRWLCKVHHLEAHHGRFGTQAPPVDLTEASLEAALVALQLAGAKFYKLARAGELKKGRGRLLATTAARKGVQEVVAIPDVAALSVTEGPRPKAGGRRFNSAPTAGTQAPPVDTILTTAEAAAAHLAPKHSGGRPKKHEDRKAYRAQKAREYRKRDKLKEGPRDA